VAFELSKHTHLVAKGNIEGTKPIFLNAEGHFKVTKVFRSAAKPFCQLTKQKNIAANGFCQSTMQNYIAANYFCQFNKPIPFYANGNCWVTMNFCMFGNAKLQLKITGICYNISLFIASFDFRKATMTLINREKLSHKHRRI